MNEHIRTGINIRLRPNVYLEPLRKDSLFEFGVDFYNSALRAECYSGKDLRYAESVFYLLCILLPHISKNIGDLYNVDLDKSSLPKMIREINKVKTELEPESKSKLWHNTDTFVWNSDFFHI